MICIFIERYDLALEAVESISPNAVLSELDEVVDMLESPIMTKQRLSLVNPCKKGQSRLLAQVLLQLVMRMDQDSNGFKLLFCRLQLVNVFRLL